MPPPPHRSYARRARHASECAFIARALRISEAIGNDRETGEGARGAKGMKGQAIDAIGCHCRRFGPASIFAFVIHSRPYRSAIAIADRLAAVRGQIPVRERLFNWPFLTDDFNERSREQRRAMTVCFRFPSDDSSRISERLFVRACVSAFCKHVCECLSQSSRVLLIGKRLLRYCAYVFQILEK